jgi:adenylate kinase
MIVVVTGMVGINKKSYLERVCRFSQAQGKEVLLCNVGDRMYTEAPDIPPGKILDIPLQRLNSLRRSVFKDIIAQSKQASNLIVNTHATFRWRHGLFPAVDFDQMRELQADLYICLMDGVAALHHRLIAEHSLGHTLKDLIVWREEEIIGTDMLRRGVGERIPFYCLARGHQNETTETFYKLIFSNNTKKAYLSFPMTAVADLEEVKQQINRFRQSMHSMFICFDPGDVEDADLPHKARAARNRGRDWVELLLEDEQVKLNCTEIQQIERDINSQTYARDFMLIDQADMIISFIPTLEDGRASISSGVERELQHAHEAGKEVYVIWTAQQDPSVFITQTATAVFEQAKEAIAYFTRKGYACT